MGQSLSEPKTEKDTMQCECERFVVGTSAMQGWRVEMEDASSVQLRLSKEESSAFFAVFDGHGGPRFAAYCSDHMHKQLLSDPDFGDGNYRCALKNTFMTLDRTLQEDPSLRLQYEPGGTTAVTVLVRENSIYCANAGDSRAIASVGGEVQELSHDHKPFHQDEESRIFKAGGWVEFNRVNGNLALSRAIGDFNFKENEDLPAEEQIITADPEIVVVDMTPHHEFIVLACDGVWDVMSNSEVVVFVRKRMAQRMPPHLICEALLDHCLAPDCRMGGLGCDNMTMILACTLQDGEVYSDLCLRCADSFSLVPQPEASPVPRDSPCPQAKSNGGQQPHSNQGSLSVSPKLGRAWPNPNRLDITAAVEVCVGRERNASSSSSSEGERSTDIDEEIDRADGLTDEEPTTCTDTLEDPVRPELETAV